MLYCLVGRGSHPHFIFDLLLSTSPFLQFCSYPSKIPPILQPLNKSNRLAPQYQHCSEVVNVEQGYLSGKKTDIINVNSQSVQKKLVVKIQLHQLCTQNSKKLRHSLFLLNLPFLLILPFLETSSPLK